LIFGAGRDMAEPLDVALVVMPFGPLQIPSIGLGLLHSAVARRGFRTRTFYFSFLFAKLIGTRFYDEVSDGEPARQDLVGEWIFSGTLFDQKPAAVEDYLDQVLRGRSAHHVISPPGTGDGMSSCEDNRTRASATPGFRRSFARGAWHRNTSIRVWLNWWRDLHASSA
jgi:hypothetical protein